MDNPQQNSPSSRIITLTMNPAVDKNATAERILPGKKLRCGPPRSEPGGGGINVARAVKRLGGDSIACYPSGGHIGGLLEKLLHDEGILQHPVPIEGVTRENFNVFETATGHEFRFEMPGPKLTNEEWQRCITEIMPFFSQPEYLVISGSLPEPDFEQGRLELRAINLVA